MDTGRAGVIVIGAGVAGLVTALELLEAGRRVLLVDRCRPDELGGLAREAFGGMFMVDTPQQRRSGIRDSHELALADWLRVADFDEGDVWPRRWAEEYVKRASDEVGGWLRGHGVRFFPVVNWAERGVYGDGNSVPRFHLTWGCGQGLVDGVGGNLDLVRREWPADLGSPPENILMGSHYYADAAMHEEVQRLGGNVTHISRMWNYADAVRHPR